MRRLGKGQSVCAALDGEPLSGNIGQNTCRGSHPNRKVSFSRLDSASGKCSSPLKLLTNKRFSTRQIPPLSIEDSLVCKSLVKATDTGAHGSSRRDASSQQS